MIKIIDTVQNRWREISTRERLLLTVAVAITLVTAVYLGLWKPVHQHLDHLRTAAPEARMQLAWMRNQRSLVSSIKNKQRASPAADILSIIETSITTHGLSEQVSQLEPVEPNGARLKFKDASFNAITKWISALGRQHGIIIDKANFDKSNKTGLVAARLVLRSSD
ncbi:MAG: type II secretion system protein M [Acidiferrobacterales bacterium]